MNSGGGRGCIAHLPGYLYLVERLPPGHELGLMLINTIRKVRAISEIM